MSDRPDQATPKWVTALDSLLERYWDLEQLVPDRDSEKVKVPPMQYFKSLVNRLNYQFAKNNCHTYYGVQVSSEGFTVCEWPAPPEIETAALHAVLEWLKPAPDYPGYKTDEEQEEEQEELRQLWSGLRRAVQNRLSQLEGEATPTSGRIQFDDLRQIVTITGRNYSVTEARAYFVYKVIAEQGGRLITKAAIARALPHDRLRGTKAIPNLLKKLPHPLRNTVIPSTRGYSLRLPKKSK